MTSNSAKPDAVCSSRASSTEPASPGLVILMDLEASLRESQRALLRRDLDRLEQLTHNQRQLAQAFAALSAGERFAVRLSPRVKRISQLGCVQLALLARARNSLRMVSNLIAGTESGYSLLAGQLRVSARLDRPALEV